MGRNFCYILYLPISSLAFPSFSSLRSSCLVLQIVAAALIRAIGFPLSLSLRSSFVNSRRIVSLTNQYSYMTVDDVGILLEQSRILKNTEKLFLKFDEKINYRLYTASLNVHTPIYTHCKKNLKIMGHHLSPINHLSI